MIKSQESSAMKMSMVLNKFFLKLVVSFLVLDPSMSSTSSYHVAEKAFDNDTP